MPNIVIIGSGPAGVSAALYAARAGVETTVLTKGPGALDRAELIQNYYGFAEPISGAELERRGIEGAKALGVQFVTTEAVGLTYMDKLTVETLAGDFPADAVILATGASRAAPHIPGLAGLEGHGISYCATCDAFFYRGKDVAVLGSGEYALHEVQALLPVVKSVTLLTNGSPLTASFPTNICRPPCPAFTPPGTAPAGCSKWPRPFMKGRWPARKPPRPCGKDNIMSEVQPSAVNRNCLACAFPFWGQLTPAEQEQLCRFTRPVKYRKGERVHSPVENCVGILLLRSGQLRAYLLSEDGRDITLYRLFQGEVCILSASCVMDSVNFDLYIDAEEDTEAYCIGAGVFRQLMQQNVYVRCYAYQMTAERFSDTMWTMQQILFMSADRRLAIFLTDELAKTGGADLHMTHDQIARYMGSAREVVSRLLKYFAGEGLVRLYRGGVEVLDKERLKQIAHGA